MLFEQFCNQPKATQLQTIIELISHKADDEQINRFKSFYEQEHKTSFLFDQMRYDYSFLEHLTLYQVVKLYDNLQESHRESFIDVIEIDHGHLHDLLILHQTLESYKLDDIPKILMS